MRRSLGNKKGMSGMGDDEPNKPLKMEGRATPGRKKSQLKKKRGGEGMFCELKGLTTTGWGGWFGAKMPLRYWEKGQT